jgi:DNA-binding CsgD family transcriptional regulator/MFS family permease
VAKSILQPASLVPGIWFAWFPEFGNWLLLWDSAAHQGYYRLIFYGSFTVAFGLLFIWRKRFLRLQGHRYLFGLACLLLSGCSILCALASSETIAVAWLYPSLIGCGIFGALAFTSCLGLMGLIGTKDIGAAMILNQIVIMALSFALVAALWLVSEWVVVAYLAALPLLMFILGSSDVQSSSREQLSEAEDRLVYNFPKPVRRSFLIIGMAFGFAFQCLFRVQPAPLMALACCVGVALFGALVMIRLRLTEEINAFTEFKSFVPATVCFFMLLPFANDNLALLLIAPLVTAWTYTTIYTEDCCHEIAAEMNVSPVDAFGQAAIRRVTGALAGMLVAETFFTFWSAYLVIPVICIGCTLALYASYGLNERNTTPVWRWQRVFFGSGNENVDRDLTAFVTRHGFTSREAEVLIFLARGRNAQHIAGKLSISHATAKTHIKRVYAKAQVHTHQELLDLMEQSLSA